MKIIENNNSKELITISHRYTVPTKGHKIEKLVYLKDLHPDIKDINDPLFYSEVEYNEIEFIEHSP